MAMIDYGAILKVDGKFVNKDISDPFMSDDHFVFVGDKNTFGLGFYKRWIEIYRNGELIDSHFCGSLLERLSIIQKQTLTLKY